MLGTGSRMRSPEEVAEDLIDKALRSGDGNLELIGLGLKTLPDSLGQLTQLQILQVSYNQLTALPESLGQLTQLRNLQVSDNQLTTLPDSLCQLKQLKTLQVSNNQLTALPDSVGQLRQLQELDVSCNRLAALPDSLRQLDRLQLLNVSTNQLTALPNWLGQLIRLQHLNVSGNQLPALPDSLRQLKDLHVFRAWSIGLTVLPEWVGELNHLQLLDVSDNQLTAVPSSLGTLKELQDLNVSHNQLIALPESLRQLEWLRRLLLHGNPGLGLRAEILGPEPQDQPFQGDDQGRPAYILDYYFRVRGGPTQPLNEAKLILVGRGDVGKTSLVNRLVHKSFNRAERKTEGIQITRWQVPVDPDPVRLYVWDFGGQEIMHATHQFFLTKRSLYLLVLSGREGGEDYDAEYWLKLIGSFGGDSPVIVVLNKIRKHPFDLNRRALQEKYPQIRTFVKTDCDEDVGIDELHEVIRCQFDDGLSSVRDQFPTEWFAIKDMLARMKENLGENFIGYDRYRELCREWGEADPKAQDNLASILHCLGIALTYKDDPRLRETSVLNPHWVTNGIYQLLNARELAKRNGLLRLEDLPQLLLPAWDYPPEKHDFLLQLMRKFKLCFAFPEDPEHLYLVPELLAKQEPELHSEFEPKGCLNFEYHYGILPEGLLPQFIVRTHVISQNQPRWRSGVVLEWERCRALVKADAAERRVVIRVRGETAEGRRQLLAVIRSDFEAIHREIPTLEVTAKVPWKDNPDAAVDYDKLVVLEREGETQVLEVIRGKMVRLDVREMLNGVDLDQTRQKALKVFISYSRKDETFCEELVTYLKLWQRRGEIEAWNDRNLLPGQEWQNKIDENLESADLFLLLVSVDSLASDYCHIELTRALERHKVVIPIIVRDCPWRRCVIGTLQALPDDGKPVTEWKTKDSAWTNVADGIHRVIEEIRRAGSIDSIF